MQTLIPQDPSQADNSIIALMHGLKTSEGTNGDYSKIGDGGTAAGIGQWSNQVNGKVQPLAKGAIPLNFQGDAKTYGLDPNDFSPENQNKVIYAVLANDKAKGLTPEQALSKWNSGDPNKYQTAPIGSGQVGGYDVAAYVKKGMSAAQQYAQQQNGTAPAADPTQPQQAPSVGGFLGNAVQSGANFLGNTADALLHPIQTVQNLGGTAVGALQELGGQTNDNTAKFDNLKNYFVQKYGGVSNVEHSLYTDPVGVLGDLSAALGIGGGALGALGKVGELSGLETAADVAKTGSSALETAAEYTNPLTPVAKGLTALTGPLKSAATYGVSKAAGIDDTTARIVQENPEAFNNQTINTADFTRGEIAKQIETVLNKKIDALDETGAGYTDIRNMEAPTLELPAASGKPTFPNSTISLAKEHLPEKFLPAVYPLKSFEKTSGDYNLGPLTKTVKAEGISEKPLAKVKVSKNFLEEQFRKTAGLDVKDGEITATGASKIRSPKDIAALQNLHDIWKPVFQKGELTNNEFLNFRQDLTSAAKYDREFSASKPVEGVAASIRKNLNDEYRSNISGLKERDAEFEAQAEELKKLRKGLIDKDGNLLETAINKVANATGKGKDKLLERLEEISPGITKKIQIQKALEDIQASNKPRVGTYTESALKAGGMLAGITTGNIPLIGGSLALAIIGKPAIAVPLLKAFDFDKTLVNDVSGKLARYITLGSVSTNIQKDGQDQQSPSTTPQTPSSPQENYPSSSPQDITQIPGYQEAIKAGYTPQEIQQYLSQQ